MMRTVEILRGRGPFTGPVVDLELPDNSGITAVSVTCRTQYGTGTIRLEETDWDHNDAWQEMASAVVGEHSERTITARVNPASHELVRWSIATTGGVFWVNFTANEESN